MSSLRSDRRKWIHARLIIRDGPNCFYCGVTFDPSIKRRTATIDHKTPECRGGRHNLENLVRACDGCNGRKGEMTAEEYLDSSELANRINSIGRKPRFTHVLLSWLPDGAWRCACEATGEPGQSPTLVPCSIVQ